MRKQNHLLSFSFTNFSVDLDKVKYAVIACQSVILILTFFSMCVFVVVLFCFVFCALFFFFVHNQYLTEKTLHRLFSIIYL